jgi:hypothetical protein
LTLLSEKEVSRSWRNLFKDQPPITDDLVNRAELLIEELRPENPLRHRLSVELDELRSQSLRNA